MDWRSARQMSVQEPEILTRHYDVFGRNVGYSVDNERKQSIVYAPATGRISESDGFKWTYLPGTNLKSSLTYPNEDVVTWTYEPHRALLTAVTNATYSTYVYTNDLLGRRTSKNDEQYGYNIRDELIAADDVSYNYDDIGNRTIAEGKTYTANNLNQYTAIDDFAPQYDADGNQTLIKTETGVWSVVYNAENRPVRWQSGDTVITMAFDRMGRRVEMRTVKDGEETLQRFVYGNYLCIQQLRGSDNVLFHSYVWDPTEPIATRPLICLPAASSLAYYFHDGNKNVSDLVDIHGSVVHYDYTPFGVLTSPASSENPYRFASEYHDIPLGLISYNYRHYNENNGRWSARDPAFADWLLTSTYVTTQLLNRRSSLLYGYVDNSPLSRWDYLGLFSPADFEGNYCGAKRVNGEYRAQGQKGVHSSRMGPPYGPKPLNAVDNCCLQHDICLAKVDESGVERCSYADYKKAQKDCDSRLSICWIAATFRLDNTPLSARAKAILGLPAIMFVAHPVPPEYSQDEMGNGELRFPILFLSF